jgi:hypothetical protein
MTGKGKTFENIRRLQSVGTITEIDIYNANTNEKVGSLTPGMIIVLSNYGLTKPSDLNFVATTSGNVGSVKFQLSDRSVLNRIENRAPFAVCGNVGQDVMSCPSLNLGSTTLTYTAYEKTKQGGAVGITSSIKFQIELSGGSVTGIDIYNANTNQKIDILIPGMNIVLSKYGLTKPSDLSFIATTSGVVGSIQFSLSNSSSLSRTENFKPFAVCGNVGTDIFNCPSLKLGPTTLKYTPYEKPNRLGMVGTTSELSFQITDSLEGCNPKDSFLYFTGHDEVSSILRGQVNITWSPAIAFSVNQSKFLWCGNVTYDIFVAQGEFDFLGANISGPDLTNFANITGSGMVRFETTNLQMVVSSLAPGLTYSFLVVARTEDGLYSKNRNQATLNISASDPIVKSNFTRMILIPEPTDLFQVNCSKNMSKVTFSGVLPKEVMELQELDFVYFFDSFGNATMAQLLSTTSLRSGGSVVWNYKPVDLTDVFDELDMDIDVTNSRVTDNSTDDLTDAVDELQYQELIAEFETLDEKIQLDFCLMAYPGSASGECYSDENIVLEKSFIKAIKRKAAKVYNKAKETAVKIVETVKEKVEDAVDTVGDVVDTVVDALDIPLLDLSETANILDINKSAKLISDGLNAGIKFDASAKARFSIKISTLKLVHRGSAQLTGGYGLEGYLYFNGTKSKTYKPPPLKLFEVNFRQMFYVGLIPIVVTNRPSLSAYIEAATAVEGAALATASIGYDFKYELSYDKDRSDKFQKITTITRRPSSLPNPTFSARLNVTAEVGVTLSWDFLLYETIQATVGVDMGLRSELEVGTNVEAMVVTSPYFYTLQNFEMDAFIRVRLMLGINNFVQDIIRQINFLGDNSFSFGPSSSFQIPINPSLTSALPAPLQGALEIAKTHPIFGNATNIALSELNSLVQDTYTSIKGTIEGLNRDFGKSFTLWSEDFSLLRTPQIVIQAGDAQICQGNNAITLRVVSQQTLAPTSILNGVQPNAMWFANFDGKIFSEDTSWVLSPDRNNVDSVTLSLPRSTISRPDLSLFEIPNEGSILLRATPEAVPFPKYSMFARASLKTLFPLQSFECCDDSDCTQRFGSFSMCTTNKICRSVESRFNGFPNTIVVNESYDVVLTVNLTDKDATDIDEFYVYRVDSKTNVVGPDVVLSLKDVGSGIGNDTIAGDFIYSNEIEVRSTFAGESIGFKAVPVIRGVPNVNSSLTFLNLNVTYSVASEIPPETDTIEAGRIDGLVLKITYSWSADKKDLDTATTFLGTRVGNKCGSSPYMNFTGDDIGLGGQETVNVFLGQSYKAGLWKNKTTIDMYAGWFGATNRGPATVSLSTYQILRNGTIVNDNNLIFFDIDPGLQIGCADKPHYRATISSMGSTTIVLVAPLQPTLQHTMHPTQQQVAPSPQSMTPQQQPILGMPPQKQPSYQP